MTKEKEQPKKKPIVSGFTKAQFMGTRQRSGIEKDILAVVLEEGKTYTIAEAEKLIQDFKKGKVK